MGRIDGWAVGQCDSQTGMMQMKNKKSKSSQIVALIVACVLVFFLGLSYRILAQQLSTHLSNSPISPESLDDFPLQIHDWSGKDVTIDEEGYIKEQIVAQAIINRIYSKDNIGRVSFFVGASGITEGTMVGHAPEVCNVSNGYNLDSERFMELPLDNSHKLPCKILQFSHNRLSKTEQKVILYYYIADGYFCKDRSELRLKVNRGSSMVHCIGQVQIAASSIGIQNTDSLDRIVCDFAVESAVLIADFFSNLKKKQIAKPVPQDNNQ